MKCMEGGVSRKLLFTLYIKCGLKVIECLVSPQRKSHLKNLGGQLKWSIFCTMQRWCTVLLKPRISVFVWQTLKPLGGGGRGRKRECVSVWGAGGFAASLSAACDWFWQSKCGQTSGQCVLSVLCEYGTCVSALLPRLSALCLQVSNLLQLHQTTSFPTSSLSRCRFALVRPWKEPKSSLWFEPDRFPLATFPRPLYSELIYPYF